MGMDKFGDMIVNNGIIISILSILLQTAAGSD